MNFILQNLTGHPISGSHDTMLEVVMNLRKLAKLQALQDSTPPMLVVKHADGSKLTDDEIEEKMAIEMHLIAAGTTAHLQTFILRDTATDETIASQGSILGVLIEKCKLASRIKRAHGIWSPHQFEILHEDGSPLSALETAHENHIEPDIVALFAAD